MNTKMHSKPFKKKQKVVKEKLNLSKVGMIAGIAASVATVLTLFFALYQNKEGLKEKAPLISLQKIDINKFRNDSCKVIVTIKNEGHRTAYFKYAYNYVLNTSTKTATAFPVFTTAEINANNVAALNFVQTEEGTMNPHIYYCTKIWYDDNEEARTQTKGLFYKLEIINGEVISSTIPNDILKIFEKQIEVYEKSPLFRSADLAAN